MRWKMLGQYAYLRFIGLLSFTFLLYAGTSHAMPQIPLDTQSDWPIDLFEHAMLIADPERRLDYQQAIEQAKLQPDRTQPNRVRPNGQRYWLVAELDTSLAHPPLTLSLGNRLFDRFDLYLVRDGELLDHQASGRALASSASERSINMSYLMPLDLPKSGNTVLVLRVEAHLFHRIIAEISPQDLANTQHILIQLISLMVFGAIIALIIYNSFLGTSLRDIAYLWYVLHASSYVLFFFSANGLLAGLLHISDPERIVPMVAATLMRLFGLLFTYYFLDIPRLSRRLRLVFLFAIGFTTLQLFAEHLIDFYLAVPLNRISHLLLTPLIIGSAIYAWRRGFIPARFVVLGWGILLLILSWGLLALIGVFPFTSLVPLLSFAAVAVEMLTLSLALADRIKQLQADKSREEAQNRSKTLYLATLSHEVRSPLSGMLGMIDLMRRDNPRPHQREQLENLHYSGHALLGLVDTLLDFSHAERGTIKLHKTAFEPRRLLESLVMLYATRARERSLNLTTEIDASVPTLLEGDAVRLRQVLINLLSNAIRFSRDGEIALVIRHLDSDDDVVRLEFSVTDSGHGIPKEEQARIFERFYQVREAGRPLSQGSGLGLAVSQEVVKLMGGEIRVQSRLGVGSRFSFVISLPQANPVTAPVDNATPTTTHPCRVLVIDDEPINRQVLCGQLAHAGHAVVSADSGVEGLEAFNSESFDLILLDWQMPELDGFAVAARMRLHTDNLRASTPIHLVTAQGVGMHQTDYLRYGINGVLFKPIAKHDLNTLLNALDNQRRGHIDTF